MRRKPRFEFVTDERRALELYPPRPAAQVVPEWFAHTPLYHRDQRRFPNLRLRNELTIRGCPGVQDYLGLGYVLPLWTDYLITAGEDGFSWEAPDERNVDVFPAWQWETCPRGSQERSFMLKIDAPWRIKTPRGWSTLLMGAWFHRDERFSIMPGVLESDHLGTIQAAVLWRAPMGQTELLRAGTPLLQLVPFRRADVDIDLVTTLDAERFVAMRDVELAQIENRLVPGAYREQAAAQQ